MSNTLKLEIIYQKSKFTLSSSGKASLYDLKRFISKKFEIPVESVILHFGQSRTKIELPDNTILENTGLVSGDSIMVHAKQSSLRRLNSQNSKAFSTRFQQIPDKNGLIMIKRVIPADNSCLFNSIAYAMENKSRNYAGYLRQVVATYIASDPEKYNEAYLDMNNEKYQKWILDGKNWGGAIEADILAKHYNTEICTIDVNSLSINVFGSEQNFKRRIYLLYDGVHYDVIARNISEDMPEEMDVTIFKPLDNAASEGAFTLSKELNYRVHHHPSELSSPKIECGACSKRLGSQNDAKSHYQQTGHYNFSQAF